MLGGRRCWWRFSPIFHCFRCSFVMRPLGKGCLKCHREGLTDIFSVCAGHLLSTRPSVNPPAVTWSIHRNILEPGQSHPSSTKKYYMKKKKIIKITKSCDVNVGTSCEARSEVGQSQQAQTGINHSLATSGTGQIYTWWIYVAEAIWQKSIWGSVVRGWQRLMGTTYCTQEKVSGREAGWKTELQGWWIDDGGRRCGEESLPDASPLCSQRWTLEKSRDPLQQFENSEAKKCRSIGWRAAVDLRLSASPSTR